MAVVTYNLVPLSCVGSLEGCRVAADVIAAAVAALQEEPRCIGCAFTLMADAATEEDQMIPPERFRRVMGDGFAFPYLWVQIRYDPAKRSVAELDPVIERFRLATVSRGESQAPFFR